MDENQKEIKIDEKSSESKNNEPQRETVKLDEAQMKALIDEIEKMTDRQSEHLKSEMISIVKWSLILYTVVIFLINLAVSYIQAGF